MTALAERSRSESVGCKRRVSLRLSSLRAHFSCLRNSANTANPSGPNPQHSKFNTSNVPSPSFAISFVQSAWIPSSPILLYVSWRLFRKLLHLSTSARSAAPWLVTPSSIMSNCSSCCIGSWGVGNICGTGGLSSGSTSCMPVSPRPQPHSVRCFTEREFGNSVQQAPTSASRLIGDSLSLFNTSHVNFPGPLPSTCTPFTTLSTGMQQATSHRVLYSLTKRLIASSTVSSGGAAFSPFFFLGGIFTR